jgi:hypothetical protein
MPLCSLLAQNSKEFRLPVNTLGPSHDSYKAYIYLSRYGHLLLPILIASRLEVAFALPRKLAVSLVDPTPEHFS